uniref:C2H2-type domain-containing protein n=1 Tax=Accipiter nisus TaxID=211598 RepID=A0A8B9MY02_9AVES
MAPGGKFKNAELILPCEWKECCFVGKCMEEFCNHIAEHLEEKYLFLQIFPIESMKCLSAKKLITHVNFHGYHTKLKFIGSQLQALHHDLPVCLQNSRSWHQLPKTSQEFVCHWENLCNSLFCFYIRNSTVLMCTFFCLVGLDCLGIFKGKHKLLDHLRTHTQERVVACPTCGGMFSNNTKFFDHAKRQVSEDKQIFVCQNCQKHFANERLLRDHMRGHVNHITCALCDMVCTTKNYYLPVLNINHKTTPLYYYICYLFYFVFSFKNAYDLHKRVETHNDSDAYSCDVEGCVHVVIFLPKSKSILKYKCHICQKSFSWSYTLTLHLRKAHKLSSHSRFRYKEDDEGHMSLNIAVYNAVMGLGRAFNNKMVTNKSSSSQNSFGREGGNSCERDTSTVEVLFTQLQPWSQATGENVLVERETSMPEPVYSELQTIVFR